MAVAVVRADLSFVAAFLAGAAGLGAVHERLRHAHDPRVALLTTVLLFAATSLYWAMVRASAPFDAAAFAIVAWLALLLARRRARSRAAVGVMWAALTLTPIVVRWAASWGAPPAPTPLYAPSIALLFSSSHGLFSLTPVAGIAFLGLLALAIREPRRRAAEIAVLLLWMLVLARTELARPPAGPFDHGLTAAVALLAPGLAFVIDAARIRPLLAVTPLVLAAITWNYWLMVQYTVGTVPKDAPVDFARLVRQQADVHTRPPYVFPFAAPASLWFAWTEQVPAARYAVLAHEPRRSSLDLTMNRDAERFLLDGWDAPGIDDSRPVHWIRERRATLAVPLSLPAGRDVELAITARARLEEPAVDALMHLEVNGWPVERFVVPASAPVELRVVVPAAIGPIWRAGYNRLTLVSDGTQRVDPGDQRPAGPLGRRAAERAWPVAIYRLRIAPIAR